MPLSQSSEHKKPDFVLEKPEIEGSEGLGAHGLCGRVANSAGNGCRLAGGRCSDTEQKTEEGDRKVPPSSVCSVRSLSLNLQVPPLWSCTTGTALA